MRPKVTRFYQKANSNEAKTKEILDSKPLFSSKFSFILGVVLLCPFVIRTIAPALEPYPAIVLPAVATKINIQEDFINIETTSIYGYNSEGKWQRIDPVRLLEPIPVHYLPKIISREFGLLKTSYYVDNKIFKNVVISGKSLEEKDQKQAKLWLANKLNSLGFNDSSLKISYEVLKLNIENREIMEKRIEDEKIISLF